MRCFILFAFFFALIVVLVTAKAGSPHVQHGGAYHAAPQQGGEKPALPLNGTHPVANSTTSSPNATTTEASSTEDGSTSTST